MIILIFLNLINCNHSQMYQAFCNMKSFRDFLRKLIVYGTVGDSNCNYRDLCQISLLMLGEFEQIIYFQSQLKSSENRRKSFIK